MRQQCRSQFRGKLGKEPNKRTVSGRDSLAGRGAPTSSSYLTSIEDMAACIMAIMVSILDDLTLPHGVTCVLNGS